MKKRSSWRSRLQWMLLGVLLAVPLSLIGQSIATDISSSAEWSETDASNNAATNPGWPESMAPSRVNDAARALQGGLKRFWNRINATVTSSGSSGVYALSYTVGPSTYVNGESYSFRANHTNGSTGASLNISALGAKSLVKPSTNGLIALGASDIASGNHVVVQYDSTADQFAVVSGLPTSQGGITSISAGTGLSGGTITSAGTISLDEAISAQTASFAVATTSHNTLYVLTVSAATAVATLPAASAVANGFTVRIKNNTDGKGATIARAGSDTIDGQTEIRVPGREEVAVTRIGSSDWVVTKRPAHMVGQVIEWTTDVLPVGGWLWANGATQSRSTYGGLFDVWGTTYGSGDGTTTFTLRDDRGRVKAGKDNMGGVSAASRLTSTVMTPDGNTLGATGGTQTHVLTTPEIPAHTHSTTNYVSSGGADLNITGAGTAGTTSNTSGSTGGGRRSP